MRKRYKNWWYGIVCNMVKNYTKIHDEDSLQVKLTTEAIEKAIKDLVIHNDNWNDKLNAIELMIFDGYSIDMTADRLNYSRRTIQYWWNDFVNNVGKYMGF